MRKCLFAAGCAASLLLLIAVSTFWVWSRSHSGYVRLHAGQRFLALYPAPNALTITTWDDGQIVKKAGNAHLNTFGAWPTVTGNFAYMLNCKGMRWAHLGVQWSALMHLDNGRTLIVPNGFLLTLFTIVPLIWLRSWDRARAVEQV
jgi:hypothetical protein